MKDQVIIYVVDGQEATHIGTVRGLFHNEPRAKLIQVRPLETDAQGQLIVKRTKKAA